MTHACEAVKTAIGSFAYFPGSCAVGMLFLWGSNQSLPVVISINILALIGIFKQRI